jgi:hypothetical protein
MNRLKEYLQHRIRYSLINLVNLVMLSTACGTDLQTIDLEPPVALALGSGGGSGLCSAVLQEIFSFLSSQSSSSASGFSSPASPSPSVDYAITGRKNTTIKTSNHSSYMRSRIAKEHNANRVTMSMVLVKGKYVFDLLNPSPSSSSSSETNRPHIIRKHNRMNLMNITFIDLLNLLDFERIVGLLLGRRAGIFETLRNMKISVPVSTSASSMNRSRGRASTSLTANKIDLIASHATWNPGSSTSNMKNKNFVRENVEADYGYSSPLGHVNEEIGGDELENEEIIRDDIDNYNPTNTALSSTTSGVTSDDTASSLLISFHVSYGSIVAKKRNHLTFRFVCPCGDNWYEPGYDMNILAETIACLPNSPPSSVQAVSPLTMLLTVWFPFLLSLLFHFLLLSFTFSYTLSFSFANRIIV